VIHTIHGKIKDIGEHYAIIETGGIGFKVRCPGGSLKKIAGKDEAMLYTHLQVREDGMDLFGFEAPAELVFFEQLISVSGVGPRSALAILDVAGIKQLTAAIKEEKPELLTRAAGIGRRTAERIVVELKGKVKSEASADEVLAMESDTDLAETLTDLGYRKDDVKTALQKIGREVTDIEERLKKALKLLSKQEQK